jgi:hypothetical protein
MITTRGPSSVVILNEAAPAMSNESIWAQKPARGPGRSPASQDSLTELRLGRNMTRKAIFSAGNLPDLSPRTTMEGMVGKRRLELLTSTVSIYQTAWNLGVERNPEECEGTFGSMVPSLRCPGCAQTDYLPYPVEVRQAGSDVNTFSLTLGSGRHMFRSFGLNSGSAHSYQP